MKVDGRVVAAGVGLIAGEGYLLFKEFKALLAAKRELRATKANLADWIRAYRELEQEHDRQVRNLTAKLAAAEKEALDLRQKSESAKLS